MPQFLDQFPEVSANASGAGFKKGLMTAMIELGAFLGLSSAIKSLLQGLMYTRRNEPRLDCRQNLAQVEYFLRGLHLHYWIRDSDRLGLLSNVDRGSIYWRHRSWNVSEELLVPSLLS